MRYLDKPFVGDEVSPDQLAIEQVLTPGRILHVGIGGSRIARRFAARSERIDGITICRPEIGAAPALPNYHVRWLNKYGPELGALAGGYDWIVDNNPSSFACCRRHFSEMMDTYVRLLAPDGRLVSHARGLAFHEPYAFGLDHREWEEEGRRRRLRLEELAPDVWALLR